MNDKEILLRLKGFEAVWKRVGSARQAVPGAGKEPALPPARPRAESRQRFGPRRG